MNLGAFLLLYGGILPTAVAQDKVADQSPKLLTSERVVMVKTPQNETVEVAVMTLRVSNIQVAAEWTVTSDLNVFTIPGGTLFMTVEESEAQTLIATVSVMDKFTDLNSSYTDLMAQAVLTIITAPRFVERVTGSHVFLLDGEDLTFFRFSPDAIAAADLGNYYIYYRGRYFNPVAAYYNSGADQNEMQVSGRIHTVAGYEVVYKGIVDGTDEAKKIAGIVEARGHALFGKTGVLTRQNLGGPLWFEKLDGSESAQLTFHSCGWTSTSNWEGVCRYDGDTRFGLPHTVQNTGSGHLIYSEEIGN